MSGALYIWPAAKTAGSLFWVVVEFRSFGTGPGMMGSWRSERRLLTPDLVDSGGSDSDLDD